MRLRRNLTGIGREKITVRIPQDANHLFKLHRQSCRLKLQTRRRDILVAQKGGNLIDYLGWLGVIIKYTPYASLPLHIWSSLNTHPFMLVVIPDQGTHNRGVA